MSTLWYPRAQMKPGPAGKSHGSVNIGVGVVCHSAEGTAGGLEYELNRPDRGAAWHFSVLKSGVVWQHYPITSVLHHAANVRANASYIGIEHEGMAWQALTEAQREASVALVHWLGQRRGWTPSRAGHRTIHEHREVSDTPTACPSGRIPWAYYALPPHASIADWGHFFSNGAKPVRVEQSGQNVRYVYEVYVDKKG